MAPPPDVRKGLALPKQCSVPRGCAPDSKRGHSPRYKSNLTGRAEPFRTSGGKATNSVELSRFQVHSSEHDFPMRDDN